MAEPVHAPPLGGQVAVAVAEDAAGPASAGNDLGRGRPAPGGEQGGGVGRGDGGVAVALEDDQGDGAAAGGRAAGGGSVPLIVFQGDRDTTVAAANAAALLSPWSGSAAPEVVPGRGWTRRIYRDGDGHLAAEWWSVHRLGHAWSGGSPEGSFTKPAGPDASAELVRFFSEVSRRHEDRPRGLRAWLGGGRPAG